MGKPAKRVDKCSLCGRVWMFHTAQQKLDCSYPLDYEPWPLKKGRHIDDDSGTAYFDSGED